MKRGQQFLPWFVWSKRSKLSIGSLIPIIYIYNDSLLKVDIIPNIRGFDPATYFRSKMVRHEERARMLTHQWFKCQTFRLWGVAYLVGKVMIELEFHGPLAE